MSDEATQAFLASLPQMTGFVRKPPGTVAIARSAVTEGAEESDHDLDAVVGWIESHGGRLVKPPPVQSHSVRGGRRTERTVPADAFYVIPASALGE